MADTVSVSVLLLGSICCEILLVLDCNTHQRCVDSLDFSSPNENYSFVLIF
jgi:hypothetical protein